MTNDVCSEIEVDCLIQLIHTWGSWGVFDFTYVIMIYNSISKCLKYYNSNHSAWQLTAITLIFFRYCSNRSTKGHYNSMCSFELWNQLCIALLGIAPKCSHLVSVVAVQTKCVWFSVISCIFERSEFSILQIILQINWFMKNILCRWVLWHVLLITIDMI